MRLDLRRPPLIGPGDENARVLRLRAEAIETVHSVILLQISILHVTVANPVSAVTGLCWTPFPSLWRVIVAYSHANSSIYNWRQPVMFPGCLPPLCFGPCWQDRRAWTDRNIRYCFRQLLCAPAYHWPTQADGGSGFPRWEAQIPL